MTQLKTAVLSLRDGKKDSDSWGWQGPRQFREPSALPIRIVNSWWLSNSIRSLVTDRNLAAAAAALMQVDSVRLLHDQVLIKPASGISQEMQTQGIVGWHQDFAYWEWINTENVCTCLIQLQDTDAQNGAISVARGSHLWGRSPDANTAWRTDLAQLEQRFRTGGQSWDVDLLGVSAGQPTFHHSLLLHSSGANLSTQPRIAIAIHYMPATARFDKNGRWSPLITAMGPNLRHNDVLNSDCFPVVWSN